MNGASSGIGSTPPFRKLLAHRDFCRRPVSVESTVTGPNKCLSLANHFLSPNLSSFIYNTGNVRVSSSSGCFENQI
jgi:hypothetical protein